MTSSWPKQKCKETEADNALRWQKLNSKTNLKKDKLHQALDRTTAIAAVHLVSL